MKFVPESDGYPPLPPPTTESVQLNPDLSREEHVTYGFPEDDPTTRAALVVYWIGPGQPFIASRYDREVTFRLVPRRRKKFVTWRDSDGQRWGRTTWESCEPRMEPLG